MVPFPVEYYGLSWSRDMRQHIVESEKVQERANKTAKELDKFIYGERLYSGALLYEDNSFH